MNLFLYMYLFTALACNHEIQHLIIIFFLNWLFVVNKNKNKKTSGSGSKFNCAARVGSGQTISGTGSGFSLKPVQTSILKTGQSGRKLRHTWGPFFVRR